MGSRIRHCRGLSYMYEGSGPIFSEIRCIALCVLQTSKEFCIFCSVNHLRGPFRKHMFTCTSSKGHGLRFVIGGFRSVLFVSCFKVRCFVIVLFRAVIDQLRLIDSQIFLLFLLLVTSNNKVTSPFFLRQKSTHHRDFLRYS